MKRMPKKAQALIDLCTAMVSKERPKGAKGKNQIKRGRKQLIDQLRKKAK